MKSWSCYISELNDRLLCTSFQKKEGTLLDEKAGFEYWNELALPAVRNGRSIFFVGNGASASMASHFAADLGKNGHLRTHTFTDLSLITALANDTSYENVFTDPIRRYLEPFDLLIAISSSGNSPNIVNAINAALELGGSVVTLSGMKPNNTIRSLGTLNVYVEASTYDLVESAHAVLLHYWVELCLEETRKKHD